MGALLIPNTVALIKGGPNPELGRKLEYPHYTRPEVFVDPQTKKELKVPKVLLSGHHKDIQAWRKEQSVRITRQVRPDLGTGTD